MKTILLSLFRNFTRKPATNLINLFGLSVSLALVIILSAYCYSELTTDNFHKNGKNIYLFSDKNNLPGINTPGVLSDHIGQSIPGVQSTLRLGGTWEAPVFKAEGREPIISDLVFADDNFFQFFTYKVVEGDLSTALKDPMSIVVTQHLSEQLFGKKDVVGKTIKFNNDRELTIKAVINEPESNSILAFSAITSMATRKILMPNDAEFSVWPFCIFQTFVKLKDGINPETTAQQISALFPAEMKQKPVLAELTPLSKIYFTQFSLFNNNYLHHGDRKKVMILLLVAALVLLIALVNFQNISAAKWFDKTKQIGTMKVNGAGMGYIICSIITEAFLFFLISLVVAFAIVGSLAPSICNYTGIKFNSQLLFSPVYLLFTVAAIFVLSLLLSLIPALKISSTKAIDNLRKDKNPQFSTSAFSSILTTAQFTIAIVLIAFTTLVQKQVKFGSSDLGMNQKNVIGIKLTPELFDKKDVLKNSLSAISTAKNISFSQYFPGEMISHGESQIEESGEKKPLSYDSFFADASFFNTMGLQLTSGRYYSDDLSTDIRKVIVNESFVKLNNITNPLGLRFKGMDQNEYEITGIVKDFRYKSVSTSIAPLAIMNIPWATHCIVEIETDNSNTLYQSVNKIKEVSAGLSPSFPVEVSFVDQAIENMYQSEITFKRAFSLFSGCAIVICCLGILAMSLFACQKRIKEIGIRKVNGARISEVLVMLNKDFVKWVAVAFIIAIPVAWYAMHKWLENFAYKTSLSWWIFALSGLLALGIALLTVSFQSWKAATRNPVEALRYE